MRKENDAAFKEAQSKKRNTVKSFREQTGKSRQELLSSRASDAAALRESKKTLSEQHKQRLQEEYLEKAATVKGPHHTDAHHTTQRAPAIQDACHGPPPHSAGRA